MNTKEVIQKCIDIAGGATALANKVGVSYKTVQEWKNGVCGISQLNCIKIEKAVEGKVKRQEILPDYPWDETKDKEDLEKRLIIMTTTKEVIQKCIDIAGGAMALANKVGVSYKTVNHWKSGRSGISQLNCIKIEKAVEGKVKKEEILPDYPWDETKSIENNDEKLEIVKKLLEKGMDKSTIVEVTGLTMEEIEKLED